MSSIAARGASAATSSASSSRSGSPAPSTTSSSKMRRTSHDSLAAHPLSGDDNDALQLPAQSPTLSGQTDGSPTKPPLSKGNSSYAVYKPKQRPPSIGNAASLTKSPPTFSPSAQVAAPTVSTSLTPASTEAVTASPKSPTSVTAKLQLQSLQATVHAAGLTSESAGWHIIQKLVADQAVQKEAGWATIHTALKSGKATLLLPKEAASAAEITPKLLRDHILLKDGSNVVTLSGIRGLKTETKILFSACVPGIDLKATTVTEGDILNLLSISPPAEDQIDTTLGIAFGRALELHIPKAMSAQDAKTPRPARPRTLASLFGGSRGSPGSPSRQGASAAGETATGTTSTSTSSDTSPGSFTTIAVSAWPVEYVLHGKKLSKAVLQSMESRVKSALSKEDQRVVDATIRFVKRFHAPFGSPMTPSSATDDFNEKDTTGNSLVGANIDVLTGAMQEFYYDIQLRIEQAEQERLALAEAMQEETEKEKPSISQAKSLDETLEKVEALLCNMLYDRIFSPQLAADRNEDESLSTRIAGLHMLDLTLDHLGFCIDSTNSSPDEASERRVLQDGIDEIVKQCGRELQKLQHADCRTPAAKLEVLVQVHKIIADSLGQLPPLPMREDITSPEATASGRREAGRLYEMSDDAKSLGGRSAKAARSEVPEERTPRLPSSRPTSTYDLPIPTFNLPDPAFVDPYPVTPGSSAFASDTADPATVSYFDTRPSANVKPEVDAISRPSKTTSADAILPLLIYAVVQANPSRLVSHTMFVQRFRADSLMRGEGEYCLTNMDAVRQFLISCDISSLGLGTDKILTASEVTVAPRMRFRTAQQIDSMVGSAGKVLGQAADLGLGGARILGGLLTRNQPVMNGVSQPKTIEEVQSVLAGGASRAASFRDSILRRGTVSSAGPSTASQNKPAARETELSDVSKEGTAQSAADKTGEAGTAPSISSRLASLPGLGRLSGSPAGSGEKVQPATVTGAVQPARTSLFSAFSLPLVPTESTISSAGVPEDAAALALPTAAQRRSTISIFPPPMEEGAAQQLSPSLRKTEAMASLSPPGTPGLYERTAPLISHSQHHDLLSAKSAPLAATRERSDSNASAASTSRRMTAFSAVSNLVSNVRHNYTPSITSLSGRTTDTAPASAEAHAPVQPIHRFLECEADDLRLSEVVLLLADYKRLAAALADLQTGSSRATEQ